MSETQPSEVIPLSDIKSILDMYEFNKNRVFVPTHINLEINHPELSGYFEKHSPSTESAFSC